MEFNLSTSLIFCILVPLSLFIFTKFKSPSASHSSKLSKSYPIFGSFFTILKNREIFVPWSSEIVTSTTTLTFRLHYSIRRWVVITANATNVKHILKNNFQNYEKGDYFRVTLKDFLGDGIFNSDCQTWKFQRQVASNEFNTKMKGGFPVRIEERT